MDHRAPQDLILPMQLLRHHLRSVVPLLALTGLVVGVLELVRSVSQLASAGPSSGLLGALGDGIDEFGVRAGFLGPQLLQFTTDANSWVTMAAIAATAVSVVSAFRSLAAWVRGPEDALAFVRHTAERAAGTLGTRATPVRWGRVYDADSGHPLPLARVSVLDASDRVIANAVADTHGIFGFDSPAKDLLARGGIGGFAARKNGYHPHERHLPVIAGDIEHSTDIPLHRAASSPVGGRPRHTQFGRAVAAAAFWGSVLTVPMVYFTEPGIVGSSLVALFGISAIVRAVGSDARS